MVFNTLLLPQNNLTPPILIKWQKTTFIGKMLIFTKIYLHILVKNGVIAKLFYVFFGIGITKTTHNRPNTTP